MFLLSWLWRGRVRSVGSSPPPPAPTVIFNRNNPLVWECDGQPTASNFQPGGLVGLTMPVLMVERTTRTVYALDSTGTVVKLVPEAV